MHDDTRHATITLEADINHPTGVVKVELKAGPGRKNRWYWAIRATRAGETTDYQHRELRHPLTAMAARLKLMDAVDEIAKSLDG